MDDADGGITGESPLQHTAGLVDRVIGRNAAWGQYVFGWSWHDADV